MTLFDESVYRQRRQQLMQKLEGGLVWILGNELSPKNYRDNPYHFRQDSNFLYYAGLDIPGLSLLLDLDTGAEYLCGREASLDDVIWMGPQLRLASLAEKVGLSKVLPIDQLQNKLRRAGSSVHYLPPYRGLSIINIHKYLGIPPKQVVSNASEDLIAGVVAQRAIKEDRELAEIEQALEISRDMHLEMIHDARPGIKESDLVAQLMTKVNQHRVDTAYPVILTVHGEILHNHHHDRTLVEGQMVLGDFGAESSMYYASDITRTVPVSSSFTSRQKEIYGLVLRAQEVAIKALQPGISYRDIHLLAAREMVQGLQSLGLMYGDVDASLAAGAHALFFPHGLGHMLGLDVHDMEDLGEDLVGYDEQVQRSSQFGLNALRLGRGLQEGFVLTVEPGIYFIPALIERWEKEGRHSDFIRYEALQQYRDFGGIRIEDNFVITAEGSRLLGPPIPKTIDEIEFLRSVDKYMA